MRPPSPLNELEAFLNDADARKPHRREHHLPREEYARTDCAFFVTSCARHHGAPFDDPALAAAVIDALRHRQRLGIWVVYAYCLMPDHLHVVIQLVAPAGVEGAPADLLTLMGHFRSFTTRAAWKAGLSGRLWQHDQYDRLLRTEREFGTRCQYVLDNPVRKGLVPEWSLWPYSGTLEDLEAGRSMSGFDPRIPTP
jgi:putative transposase